MSSPTASAARTQTLPYIPSGPGAFAFFSLMWAKVAFNFSLMNPSFSVQSGEGAVLPWISFLLVGNNASIIVSRNRRSMVSVAGKANRRSFFLAIL